MRVARRNGTIAVAILALLGLCLLAPVVAVAGTFICATLSHRRAVPASGFATVAVVASIFAWVNVGKAISGDWVWYTTHFRYLETLPLADYLGHRIGRYNPDVTEPIYYTLSSVVARLSGANVNVLATVVTLLIYISIGVAVVLAVSSYTSDGWTLVAATIAGMLTGITFTLSTQLVRQEIAASFIGLGIVLVGMRKMAPGILVLVGGVLTHNSALIPAAGIVLAVVLARANRGWFLRLFVSAALFFALGRLYLATSGGNVEGELEGSISTPVILMDLLIVAVFAYLVRRGPLKDNPVAHVIVLCMPAFYGFVLAVLSQPLALLRMYFYIEVLRALMVAFIVLWLMRGRLRIVIGVIAIAMSIIYVQLRIASSPFDYASDLVEVLLKSPLIESLK